MMRGAWIVETVILGLILLLVGKYFGIAITHYALGGALLVAALIRFCIDVVRRFFKPWQ